MFKCNKPQAGTVGTNMFWWKSPLVANGKKKKLALVSDTDTYKFPIDERGYIVGISKDRFRLTLEMKEFGVDLFLSTVLNSRLDAWKLNYLT